MPKESSNPFEFYRRDPAFATMHPSSQMRDIAIAKDNEIKCRKSIARLTKKYGARCVYYCTRTERESALSE